jgi:hypothetical protein
LQLRVRTAEGRLGNQGADIRVDTAHELNPLNLFFQHRTSAKRTGFPHWFVAVSTAAMGRLSNPASTFVFCRRNSARSPSRRARLLKT